MPAYSSWMYLSVASAFDALRHAGVHSRTVPSPPPRRSCASAAAASGMISSAITGVPAIKKKWDVCLLEEQVRRARAACAHVACECADAVALAAL